MCFTPWVSLTTSILEIAVGTLVLILYKDCKFNKLTAAFLYVLGLYQLTEFFLCTTSYTFFWAKMGFIVYSFLPPIGFKLILDYVKVKINTWLIFLLPILYSLYALFNESFVQGTTCDDYFVSAFFIIGPQNIPGLVYLTFYFGTIIAGILLLIRHYRQQKDKILKELDFVIITTTFFSLVPAAILIFILPAFKVSFPSIYCEFSFIYTIGAILMVYLHDKRVRQKKDFF